MMQTLISIIGGFDGLQLIFMVRKVIQILSITSCAVQQDPENCELEKPSC